MTDCEENTKEESAEQKSIEQKVVELLKKRKMLITTAESCTAGLVASAIVNVAGASSVFKQGYITYSDNAKHELLGVKEQTLKKYFAVSKETAFEMAKGGADAAAADVCVAVTGVAGPDTEDGKPVGLVYIGCCVNGCVTVKKFTFDGDRAKIRNQAAYEALNLVYDCIK